MKRLKTHRTAIEAVQRRRRIALWLEHLERIEQTPARTPEELRAKQECLELMRQAYPEQNGDLGSPSPLGMPKAG